jgi:hypothetical protein
MKFVVHVRIFGKIKSIYKSFVSKSEVRTLSQIKVMTLKFILQQSRVGCQLDSSGSVYRISEGTTVPAGGLSSVRDSEVATQIIYYSQNLNTTAAHYYGLYCIDPSEHSAVAVAKWPT